MNFLWKRKVWLIVTITFKDKCKKPVVIETFEKRWAKNNQEVVDFYMGRVGFQLREKEFLEVEYPVGKYWGIELFEVSKIESVDVKKRSVK